MCLGGFGAEKFTCVLYRTPSCTSFECLDFLTRKEGFIRLTIHLFDGFNYFFYFKGPHNFIQIDKEKRTTGQSTNS